MAQRRGAISKRICLWSLGLALACLSTAVALPHDPLQYPNARGVAEMLTVISSLSLFIAFVFGVRWYVDTPICEPLRRPKHRNR